MTNAVSRMEYEEMFKDISKDYGGQVMETGETIRIMQDYEGETFKLEEGHNSLSAFGLAALVQNGFPTTTLFSLSTQQELDKLRAEEDTWISSDESIPWTDSKIASYNSVQKLFRCNECECVGFLSRVAEHWLGTHANLRVFQCPQCPYSSAWARCVRMHLARQHNVCPDPNQESLTLWKENPVLEEVTKYLERLKNLIEGECEEQMRAEEEENIRQNATSTQTSTPPPPSPGDEHLTSPVPNPDHDDMQDHVLDEDIHQQEIHQQELHQQELHQQELHQQELQQQELHQQELHQQELHQQELHQQELHHQELHEQELHQQELDQQELQQEYQQELSQHGLTEEDLQQEYQQDLSQQDITEEELQQQLQQQQELQEQELREQELQAQELEEQDLQEGQITHVIEEHIQVPEEVANQLQQIAAAQHGEGHPHLQIVITQQENSDLPPTIQVQIVPQDLSSHLVSSGQQTLPLQQALTQTLATTLAQHQVITQAQQTVISEPVRQQVVVQRRPEILLKTSVTRPRATPPPSPSRPRSRGSDGDNGKRYNCSYCHYATDRRDLYTRHENIHRDEKPFHCYLCQKQFNRADHVKKHFLRMHRDVTYDINKIRRAIPKESSTSTIKYFAKPRPVNQQETIASGTITIPGNMTKNERRNIRRRNVEKRYTCCYCTWTGVDNWCLKRHLNTHLKPYKCSLCEYKAARAERLATHVFKVHNKKSCTRCSYMADDQNQLILHQQQNHHSNNFMLNIKYQNQKDENYQHNLPKTSYKRDGNRNYYQNIVDSTSTFPPLSESQLSLRCILCGMQTISQRKMQEHMQFHSATPRLSLDSDDDLLEDIPLLTIIHEDIPPGQQCRNKKRLLWQKYGWRLLERKRIYCRICRNNLNVTPYYNKATLARHFLSSHFRGSIKCSSCRIGFRYAYQLNLHRKSGGKRHCKVFL